VEVLDAGDINIEDILFEGKCPDFTEKSGHY
jgi:hypothetical protein